MDEKYPNSIATILPASAISESEVNRTTIQQSLGSVIFTWMWCNIIGFLLEDVWADIPYMNGIRVQFIHTVYYSLYTHRHHTCIDTDIAVRQGDIYVKCMY